jgi:hypothetical protein
MNSQVLKRDNGGNNYLQMLLYSTHLIYAHEPNQTREIEQKG